MDHPSISREHALVAWVEERWEVRDLGSKNGSTVDGRRLEAGETLALRAGAVLRFGDAPDAWRLVDAGPPVPFAVAVDGQVAIGRAGALTLGALLITEADEGWQTPSGAVVDRQVIRVGDSWWTLHLPERAPATRDLRMPSVTELTLELVVTRDEEYVEARLVADRVELPLPERAHLYTLVTLARRRLADEGAGLPDPGWVHREALAADLGCEPVNVNMHLSRLRKDLRRLGLREPDAIVAQRPRTGLIRLAVRDVRLCVR